MKLLHLKKLPALDALLVASTPLARSQNTVIVEVNAHMDIWRAGI
jgi:hypothetical protein